MRPAAPHQREVPLAWAPRRRPWRLPRRSPTPRHRRSSRLLEAMAARQQLAKRLQACPLPR